MSADEFLAASANLSNVWPAWLPNPIDLDCKWATVYCGGNDWMVDTPLEEKLLSIAAEVRAVLGKQPPAPKELPAQQGMKAKRALATSPGGGSGPSSFAAPSRRQEPMDDEDAPLRRAARAPSRAPSEEGDASDSDSEELRCVVSDLPLVAEGTAPSRDRVLCPVRGCALSRGDGLLRGSVVDHFAGKSVRATHGRWTVVVPEQPAAKRARAADPELSEAEKAGRAANFFVPRSQRTQQTEEGSPAAAAPAPTPALFLSGPTPQQPQAEPRAAARTLGGQGDADAAPAGADVRILASAVEALRLQVQGLGVRVSATPKLTVELLQAGKEATRAQAVADRVKGDTVAELAALNNFDLREGFVLCLACGAHAPRLSQGRVPGMFAATRPLNDLRKDLGAHMELASHRQACEAAAQAALSVKKINAYGENVGRVVYFMLKEAMSYTSYERLLELLDGSGVDVGTLNHSRKFAAAMVPHFLTFFKRAVRAWAAKPVAIFGDRLRAFCEAADKMTAKRRTQELYGVSYLCEEVGEIKALLLGDVLVKPGENDAKGLADAAFKMLDEMLGISAAEALQRIAGFCRDGAYIMENIGKELLAQAGAKDAKFLLVTNDAAHQAERFCGDVAEDKVGKKKLNTVEWLPSIPVKLSAVNNQFAYGKAHEEARLIAEETGDAFRDPKKIIETRFTATKLKAVKSYLASFTVFNAWYKEHTTIPPGAKQGKGKKLRTKLNAEERAKLELYNLLRNRSFVGRLLLLRDVLSWVSEFSLAAQTVNILPWELREKEMALYERLGVILEEARHDPDNDGEFLSAANFPYLFSPADAALPNGPTVYDEFKAGRFAGVTLVPAFVDDDDSEHEYTLAEQAKLLVDEVGDYCDALHHFMKLRSIDGCSAPRQGENGGHVATIPGAKEAYHLIEECGRCFDLRGLCQDPCPLVDRDAALTRILACAAGTGVVFDVQGGRPSLHQQLETLRLRLMGAFKEMPYSARWSNAAVDNGRGMQPGTVIMRDLLLTPALHNGLGDIMYVFQHAVLKGRNEAVIEGMGSMVSLHADKTRGRLGFEQYSVEAIFHYNFPPLSHPASRRIVKEVLTEHFGRDSDGKPKQWHFSATSAAGQASVNNERSIVLRRLDAAEARHAFMAV